jgi:hypothetical protein
MTLNVEQSNVMQVFEFREEPEPMIIMANYPDRNIVDTGVVDDERYVSALAQILDGLSHLHATRRHLLLHKRHRTRQYGICRAFAPAASSNEGGNTGRRGGYSAGATSGAQEGVGRVELRF